MLSIQFLLKVSACGRSCLEQLEPILSAESNKMVGTAISQHVSILT